MIPNLQAIMLNAFKPLVVAGISSIIAGLITYVGLLYYCQNIKKKFRGAIAQAVMIIVLAGVFLLMLK